jgi:hypothetical protein
MKQAEIIQNHENKNVRNIGQGETPHCKYRDQVSHPYRTIGKL